MKAFTLAILIVAFLHVLATFGFAGWLYGTGRLNRERVMAVVETFKPTLEEEARQKEEATRLEAEAKAVAENAARLEATAEGPLTLTDRLAADEQKDEVAVQRLERLQRETTDLRRQIDRAKELLAKQKGELDDEREAFDDFVASTTTRLQDSDFQQAVGMYEGLKPRQSKQMFQDLIAKGETEKVVNYLASMQGRKAAAVLKEFKSPPEIEQATMLIQKLSERGVYPVPNAPLAEANPR